MRVHPARAAIFSRYGTVSCLGVSRSRFYTFLKDPAPDVPEKDARLRLEIRVAHKETRETYGTERLQAHLADKGVSASRYKIRKLRSEMGIRCKQKRTFKITTDSSHKLPFAPNLVAQEFEVQAFGKLWLSDITYVRTREGWLYVCCHQDAYNGEIVGYAMASRMTRNLVLQSLLQAYRLHKPKPGLIHHSDRGSQYCAKEVVKKIDALEMKLSMSRKGNCYDNAPIESHWGKLKTELVHHERFATRREAVAAITEYIEVFYNRIRKQERLGYRSPVQYRNQEGSQKCRIIRVHYCRQGSVFLFKKNSPVPYNSFYRPCLPDLELFSSSSFRRWFTLI